MKKQLTPNETIAKECGKLVLWYIPLILIGVFLGWLWAFLALTALYIVTLTATWSVLEIVKERANADD